MSREPESGAFPFVSHGGVDQHQYVDPGMSLRDYFAAQALAFRSPVDERFEKSALDIDAMQTFHDLLAKRAYQIADAMLRERSNPTHEKGR